MAVKRQKPLYEQVYELLWDKFLSGEISSTDRIRDADWAKKLNVSRTPVREAFRKIEHEGIIETKENGRYKIREFTSEDLAALYRCRAALEGVAAYDATQKITPKEIEKLKAALKRAEGAVRGGDSAAAAKANTEFHDIIWKASGNFHVTQLLISLRRIILFCRRGVLDKATHNESTKNRYADHLCSVLKDHHGIIASLAGGQPELAEARMREHLQRTSKDMTKIVNQKNGKASQRTRR